MKKLALAAIVTTASTFGTGAWAAVNSNVTDAQMWIGYFDIENPAPCGNLPLVSIGGNTPNNVTMDDHLCLEPAGAGNFPVIQLDFALTNGVTSGAGTTFNGGTIDIWSDTGSGFVYYGQIVVGGTALPSIPCLVNLTGHLGIFGGVRVNTTFGLQVPPATITSPLPGPWSGAAAPSMAMNDAVCVTSLLGQTAGMFLSGTISN